MLAGLPGSLALAEAPVQSLQIQTRFTLLVYRQEKELIDFLWRITGRRTELSAGLRGGLARVDEVVERVQSLLGMYPEAFRVEIRLKPNADGGEIAFYSAREKAITVAADRVTPGVLAHEIAHAVMDQYFETPPPRQMQEILAQYVDRHLWGE